MEELVEEEAGLRPVIFASARVVVPSVGALAPGMPTGAGCAVQGLLYNHSHMGTFDDMLKVYASLVQAPLLAYGGRRCPTLGANFSHHVSQS